MHFFISILKGTDGSLLIPPFVSEIQFKTNSKQIQNKFKTNSKQIQNKFKTNSKQIQNQGRGS